MATKPKASAAAGPLSTPARRRATKKKVEELIERLRPLNTPKAMQYVIEHPQPPDVVAALPFYAVALDQGSRRKGVIVNTEVTKEKLLAFRDAYCARTLKTKWRSAAAVEFEIDIRTVNRRLEES